MPSSGSVAVGPALRQTAASPGLGCLHLETQTVGVSLAASRRGKPAVTGLTDQLGTRLPDLLGETPGYDAPSDLTG